MAVLVTSQASVQGFVEESMKLAGAKHVLQSKTGGTEGQTYLLFQESSPVVQRLRHISQDPFEVHWPAALMGRSAPGGTEVASVDFGTLW